MQKLRSILDAHRALKRPADKRPAGVERTTWDRVVGPRIAVRSEPYRLEHGTLLVRVASSAWANELSMLCEPIVAQLQAEGVEVSGIRFVVGEVALSPRRTRGPSVIRPPRDAPLPQPLAELLAKIGSPELRDALGRAAAKSLALAQVAVDVAGEQTAARQRRTAPLSANGAKGAPMTPLATAHPRKRPAGPAPESRPARARPWVDRAPESVLPRQAAVGARTTPVSNARTTPVSNAAAASRSDTDESVPRSAPSAPSGDDSQ